MPVQPPATYNLVCLSSPPTRPLAPLLRQLGVSDEGSAIMAPKGETLAIRFEKMDSRGANILKQEALARDGDCAVPWGGIILEQEKVDGLLIIEKGTVQRLIEKLRSQPFGLKAFSAELAELVDNLGRSEAKPWRSLLTGSPPWVMGIVNVTPDSFSDGGDNMDFEVAIKSALAMESAGASIVDIGGQSTRPGAAEVTTQDELARVLPVFEGLRGKLTIPISIDTDKPAVAEKALDAGATWLNDVTGFSDAKMRKMAAERECVCCVMHMQGTPRTMQADPRYEDVVFDTARFFRLRMKEMMVDGIHRDKIVIDPGFGFGKTVEHNVQLIRRLGEYRSLGQCVMVGVSRKSTIGKLTGKDNPKDRLHGTLAMNTMAIMNGADIVRVHDVGEHADGVRTIGIPRT